MIARGAAWQPWMRTRAPRLLAPPAGTQSGGDERRRAASAESHTHCALYSKGSFAHGSGLAGSPCWGRPSRQVFKAAIVVVV